MKSLSYVFSAPVNAIHKNPVSLHQLVGHLVNSFLPLAVSKQNFFVNDIDRSFQVDADEQVLAFAVGNMMLNAIRQSRSSCVRIDVVQKYNGIQLRIRNNGICYYGNILNSLETIAA